MKVHPNDHLITQLFDLQPDSVVWFRPVFDDNHPEKNQVADFEVQYCNSAAAHVLGVTPSEVVGARLLSTPLVDKESRHKIFEQCLSVWNTGDPIEFTYYSPGKNCYFNVQRSKVEGGILSITRDRTKEVKAELGRLEQEKQFQYILDTSSDGVLLLESIRDGEGTITDFRITYCNKSGFTLGQLPPDAIGKTIFEVLPHMKGHDQLLLHKQVADTGQPVRFETTFMSPEGEEYGWFIVSLTKMEDGVVSRFTDITQRKQHEQQIEEQKNLLNNVFETSINGMFVCETIRNDNGEIVDFLMQKINHAFTQMTGFKEEEVIGNTYLSLFPASKDYGIFELNCQAFLSGISIRREIYYKDEKIDAWCDVSICKLGANGLVVTFADVTAKRKAHLELEQSAEKLHTIINTSLAGFFLGKPVYDDQGQIIDFRFTMVNDVLASFVGKTPGELIGELGSKWFERYKSNGLFERFLHSYLTGIKQQFDFHYIGETVDVWASIMTTKLGDELLGTFTDFTPIKRLQLQLEKLVEELKRSNANLEEFAYAASHDLQEPLRKIGFFSDKLKNNLAAHLSGENSRMFERMESATIRMRSLINNLLAFSKVSMTPDVFTTVDLNSVVQQVVQDFEATINETGAIITVGKLPTVKGDELQLRQLFQNLLSNALKYHKPGVIPEVSVKAVDEKHPRYNVRTDGSKEFYHLIEISDNGIGFEQENAEKIFQVFQRLHGRAEYEGTGVGLAIVQKVVTNHNGYITAEGEPGKGATFKVWLPA